jgi:hypothetical protein
MMALVAREQHGPVWWKVLPWKHKFSTTCLEFALLGLTGSKEQLVLEITCVRVHNWSTKVNWV